MEATSDWRDVFCGRQQELSILVQKFKDVHAGRGPRIAVVLGDRGMGKTRLVQEFYRLLTIQYDPTNYWPDASLFKGNNLLVAPELGAPSVQAHYRSFKLEERPMPFLWWGFRLADATARNANRSDMAAHRATLDPHLMPLFFARRLAAVRDRLKNAGVDSATEMGKSLITEAVKAIPGIGIAASVFELFLQYADKGKQAAGALRDEHRLRAEQGRIDLSRADSDRIDDIQRRTLDDLAALLAPGPDLAPLPVIVFCDDAQFACTGGDEGAQRLLTDLWLRASLADWPLLLVLTHWSVEWYCNAALRTHGSCADSFRMSAASAQYGVLIDLPKERALADLVISGLPGLTADDVSLLLTKADGNPQVLIELVDLVRRSPAWRRRDSGVLTPHARKEIEFRATSLAALILERLESDTTSEPVRQAVGLSSVQGIEFPCALTKTAAQALDLHDTVEGLIDAQRPHRLIVGVEEGVASFVQRAYREAATALLSSHVGEPAAVREVVLTAAIGMIDDLDQWQGLSFLEQTAVLGVLVGLAEDHPEATMRHHAGRSLLWLIQAALNARQGRDYARAAELAQRFEAGLGSHWAAEDFGLAALDVARDAIAIWHGPAAASSLARSMLVRCRELAAQFGTPEARNDLSVSLNNMGEVTEAAGNLAQAGTLYRESLAICRELAAQLGTPDARRNLSSTLDQVGRVAQANGDWAQAETLYRESLTIRRELATQLNTPEARRNLSVSLSLVGRVKRANSEWAQAAALYRESLTIRGELASQLATPEAKRDVSLAFTNLGVVAEAQGDWTQAEKLLSTSVEISRELVAQLGTHEARRDLLLALDNLGRVAQAQSEWVQAEKLHRESLEIGRELAAQLGTPTARRDVGVALGHLGRIAEERSEWAEAEVLSREFLTISRELFAQLGTPDVRRDVSRALCDVGVVAQAKGDWPQADSLYRESLAIRRELAAQLGTPGATRDVGVCLVLLADLAVAVSDKSSACNSLREALPLFEGLAQLLGTRRSVEDLEDVRSYIAEIGCEPQTWHAS